MDRIFIIIAAYNESPVLPLVVSRLSARYSNIVIVDDGSTDGTFDCVNLPNVFRLRHVVNRGQGAALQTGIAFALARGANIVVTFDADGQHDENDVDSLVGAIQARLCDVALGSRFLGTAVNIPLTRLIVLKLGIWFTRLVLGVKVTDVHNGLRAFSERAARSLHITIDRMGHASEILEQIKAGGWRYREIPVRVTYSAYSVGRGQSSWSALILGSQMLLRRFSR